LPSKGESMRLTKAYPSYCRCWHCFRCPGRAAAAYLTNVPVTVTQPDGRVLICLPAAMNSTTGCTIAGLHIMQDPGNGYYVYAIKIKGELVPSTILPGRASIPNHSIAKASLGQPGRRPARQGLFPSPGEIINAPHSGRSNNLVISSASR